MSLRHPGPPAALPLSELLEALRDEGLPIGVREHLLVGRLLARWPDCDSDELRSALAALLARNPRETQMVLAAFDRLYDSPLKEESGTGTELTRETRLPSFWRRVKARWVIEALLLLLLAVAAGLLREGGRRPAVEPIAIETPAPPPAVAENAPAAPRIPERETTIERLNWWKAVGVAFLGAAVGLGLVYRRRTSAAARRFMRRRWTGELDALPGPATYELKLETLEPPFRPDLLDDVTSVLGRHLDHTLKGTELDVDRTLARTLRAGLAPHVVWSARALSLPVLVLEDVGPDMRPWRYRVAALLDGLAARGLALERWQFDADASRLFKNALGASATLRQLARRRSEHPLLVISAGQGIREGEDRKLADWVGLLRHWRSRAWLHPVSDLRYWRAEMREVGLYAWPMTPQGVLAAAQQLARGEARLREVRDIGVAADRPVAPLDVERLQWLLSLAPRRDPELAELLRQRFCPHVPPATLLEALAAAAPPATGGAGRERRRSAIDGPGVGPTAAEVHAFLAGVLSESEPALGTAAHERWRLDRALQEIQSGRVDAEERARRDLAELAAGPAAPLVEDATNRAGLEPSLERDILSPLDRRARREKWVETGRASKAWTRPHAPEFVAAVVCGLVALAAGSRVDVLTRDAVTRGQEVYRLELIADGGPPKLVLSRRPEVTDVALAPDVATLMGSSADAGDYQSSSFDLANGRNEIVIPPESFSDHFFWARADRPDGLVALSNMVAVGVAAAQPSLSPTATPVTPTPGPTRPAAYVQSPTPVPAAVVTREVARTATPEPRPTTARGPAIDSVSPGVIRTPGSVELTIRGAGFYPEAVVEIKWSGLEALRSRYVSASELVVPIEVYADSASGTVGFIVRNPDGQMVAGSFRIELRPAQNEPTPTPVEPEPNQTDPGQRPPQQQEPPPEESVDCKAFDLSGTWTTVDEQKRPLQLELKQDGCSLYGTFDSSRYRHSINAKFVSRVLFPATLDGNLLIAPRKGKGCTSQLDVRIQVRDNRTMTVESSGSDCQTKKRIDEKREWSRTTPPFPADRAPVERE